MSDLVMSWNEINVGSIIHNENGEDYIVVAINPKLDRTLLVKANTDKPFYVGAWALQKCRDGVNWFWGQGHYFMDELDMAINYVMNISQKVYTVHYQQKLDYDFSVETINCGCFKMKEIAIAALNKVVEKVKAEHEDDIEKYSDLEEYPDEESGGLHIYDDGEYFHMNFGYQEHYESHTVWYDEWEVK